MNQKMELFSSPTNPISINLKKKTNSFPLFYRKVWTECSNIPAGETRTYGWIAKKVGHPGAARAVGQALAKNPFAPIVPCHRVIRSDGKLGGYSAPGGLLKKKRLLIKEKFDNFRCKK